MPTKCQQPLVIIGGIFRFLSTFNDGAQLVYSVVTEEKSEHPDLEIVKLKQIIDFKVFCGELSDCNDSAYELYELHLKADEGDYEAIKYLSLIYTFGYQFYDDEPRINPNFEKALHYSQILQERGDITALYNIGIAYKIGDEKVPQNIPKAIEYLIEFIDKTEIGEHADYRAKALTLIMDSYLRQNAPKQVNTNNIERFKPQFVKEISHPASGGKLLEIGQLSQVYFALSSDKAEKMTAYGWTRIGLKSLESNEITANDKIKYKAMFEEDIARMERDLSEEEIQRVKQVVDKWQKGEVISKNLFE